MFNVPIFADRKIRRPSSESSGHEESAGSDSEAQEGSEERDLEAGTDSEGSQGPGQEGVEEQDAEQERGEVQEEEVVSIETIYIFFNVFEWILMKEIQVLFHRNHVYDFFYIEWQNFLY